MKNRNTRFRIILHPCLIFNLLFIAISSATAQVVPESYRHEYNQQRQQHADSIDNNFYLYLEQLWEEWELFVGEPRPVRNKPQVQPTYDEPDTLMTDRQVPYQSQTFINRETTKEIAQEAADGRLHTIHPNHSATFYGETLIFQVPQGLSALHLPGVREKQVSRLWRQFDQSDMLLDRQLLQYRRDLYLNDWGLLMLADSLSASIYPNLPNEQAVLTVWMMNRMHFDVRLGRIDKRLVVLLHSSHRLYNIPFIEIDSTRYYALHSSGKRGRISTYRQQPYATNHECDMRLTAAPLLNSDRKHTAYNRHHEDHNIRITSNPRLIAFYASYPQTELEVYAQAAVSGSLTRQLEEQLRPYIVGQSTVGALNTLLEYIQEGFSYQTDIAQFGHEKNFFCEENFYYPANDCEDRAVLFARMADMLLGLDAVLLEYKDHVATAVCVPESRDANYRVLKRSGIYVELNGKRYYACDPTCHGAHAGQLSRKYRRKTPDIITIKAN